MMQARSIIAGRLTETARSQFEIPAYDYERFAMFRE
jgi:hypothetical protein